MKSDTIKELVLGGAIPVTVTDTTRHYFGGYYHVSIEIHADVPLSAVFFDSEESYQDALRRMGQQVRFLRKLEKMAVPEDEVAVVRNSLLESFDKNVLPYLSRPDFPGRLVTKEYAKCLKEPVR